MARVAAQQNAHCGTSPISCNRGRAWKKLPARSLQRGYMRGLSQPCKWNNICHGINHELLWTISMNRRITRVPFAYGDMTILGAWLKVQQVAFGASKEKGRLDTNQTDDLGGLPCPMALSQVTHSQLAACLGAPCLPLCLSSADTLRVYPCGCTPTKQANHLFCFAKKP